MSCKNTITTCIKCYRKINSSFNLCRYGTKSPLFISLQWGMLVTNVEQGKNNTFTFPIAFKNNLYFYWAFDCVGYFYNLIIKNKDINSCYIYGVYPNGTEQTGELAPTGVSGISVFIGS